MAVYITIALGITLLIGIGWFIKSYFDGKTVFNNNSIQQYAYDLHQPKTLSSINIYLPKRLEILAQEGDDQDEDEEDEELEDEEEMDEPVELENEEDIYEGTEQVDSSNNNSSNGTVRDDVYGG